jgi:glycosyltransferase involved in cell wall biosynthesis
MTAAADVTVITPTIPGREQELARCLDSVYWQSTPPVAHVVIAKQRATDEPRQVALARAQNQALRAVETEWVLRLADDDWLMPTAIEALLAHQYEADVIYGPDRDEVAPMIDLNGYSPSALAEFFRTGDSGQASGDLYRVRALRAVGGWTTDWTGNHFHHAMSKYCLRPYEDAATRAVLAQAGYRFRYITTPTWAAGLYTPDRIGDVAAPLVLCG